MDEELQNQELTRIATQILTDAWNSVRQEHAKADWAVVGSEATFGLAIVLGMASAFGKAIYNLAQHDIYEETLAQSVRQHIMDAMARSAQTHAAMFPTAARRALGRAETILKALNRQDEPEFPTPVGSA